MRTAAVFRRDNRYILHACSRTTDGVWILSGPCVVLPDECTDLALGQAIEAALVASVVGVPHPRDWQSVVEPLLSAASVRSWRSFMKGAAHLSVEVGDSVVALVPMRNLGARDGFEPQPAARITLAPGSTERFGAEARRILST